MGRVKQVLTHWLEGFRSKNIQYTIALAFTGITLVAMTLVGIVLYTGFFSSAETMMKENNTRLVEQIGLNLDMYLKNMMRVSETAYYRVIKKHDLAVDDIGEQIELLYDANKDLLVSIVILDPEGNVLTSAPAAKEKEAQTAKDQAWFREALDKIENFHFSLPHVQNLFDDPDCRYRWVVSLSRAVELTENGQVGQGVLLLDINFSGIEQIFNNAGYGDSGYAYLVGEDGEMIYHPRQQLVYSDLFEEDSLAYVGEEDGNYIGKVNGQDSVITVKTVGYTGWKIVRVAPVGIYSDDVLFIQLAGLIGVVCLAILIILVNQSVSSQIARPVEELQKSVEKLENGDLDTEIAIGGSYEIQRLGRTVQSMAQEMKKLMADKVRYKNKFTVTFDTDPEVLELSTVTALGWNTSIRNGRRSRTKGQCSPWRYWRCTTWASPMRRKTGAESPPWCPFWAASIRQIREKFWTRGERWYRSSGCAAVWPYKNRTASSSRGPCGTICSYQSTSGELLPSSWQTWPLPSPWNMPLRGMERICPPGSGRKFCSPGLC
ncbi:cache domain-containing protein [Pseudoflavonifractor sp. An187]|uniref:HAMP domain-containing protein n=1 Tax=Pseudoflavonifractor sp. An187 TaxID=1965578 RepID=UPI000B385F4C|nr:cache domain-containing protein [Pseudoflavonifractor sp. An187]OUP46113.1 hypothetical protein B5F22_02440 [Pseudoflavonifractor sp. An187]